MSGAPRTSHPPPLEEPPCRPPAPPGAARPPPSGRCCGTTPSCTRPTGASPGWPVTTTASSLGDFLRARGFLRDVEPSTAALRRPDARLGQNGSADPRVTDTGAVPIRIRRTHGTTLAALTSSRSSWFDLGVFAAGMGLLMLAPRTSWSRDGSHRDRLSPGQHPADRGHREVPDGPRQRRGRHRGRLRLLHPDVPAVHARGRTSHGHLVGRRAGHPAHLRQAPPGQGVQHRRRDHRRRRSPPWSSRRPR